MSFKKTYSHLVGQCLGLGTAGAPADRYLDDLPNLTPTGLDDIFHVLQCLVRLRLDTAFDKRASLWIEAKAARHKDERRAHDGQAVRPNRRGGVCTSPNQISAHYREA